MQSSHAPTGHSSGTAMLDAALTYLRLGWPVIPIEPLGKRPLIGWKVYQQRQPTHAEVTAWFRRWPTANLAVVTGAVSGLVVMDLDPRHGATASFARIEHEHGPLEATVAVLTGGGGRHLYFAHPGEPMRNRVGVFPGIDLRGDGGYVIAPPSVHENGQRYRWQHRPGSLPVGQLPDWLHPPVPRRVTRAGRPLSHWRQLLRQGIAEGNRNNTIASLAGHLLWHGVDPAVTASLMLSWNVVRCRPPLPEHEVERTVASIARLHQGRSQEAPDVPLVQPPNALNTSCGRSAVKNSVGIAVIDWDQCRGG